MPRYWRFYEVGSTRVSPPRLSSNRRAARGVVMPTLFGNLLRLFGAIPASCRSSIAGAEAKGTQAACDAAAEQPGRMTGIDCGVITRRDMTLFVVAVILAVILYFLFWPTRSRRRLEPAASALARGRAYRLNDK